MSKSMRRYVTCCVIASIGIMFAWAGPNDVLAADTVVWQAGKDRKPTTVTGEIVDWFGRELVLKRASGKEERIPSERVTSVETQWNDDYRRAAQLQSGGQCEQALVHYRQSVNGEMRTWVRRRILARMVECYTEIGQFDLAGDSFATLIQSDPESPEFAVIPLNWGTVQPNAGTESRAAKWISAPSPTLRLLGASWLLSSARRAEAVATLNQLLAHDDPRIALLARAQTWRTEVATADQRQIDHWKTLVQRMPEPLRAGPYFVVADALARRNEHQAAVLTWMRIPILYPHKRQFAAEALWAAAGQLERAGQTEEAQTLYREIVTDHGDAPISKRAEVRLGQLQQTARQPAGSQSNANGTAGSVKE